MTLFESLTSLFSPSHRKFKHNLKSLIGFRPSNSNLYKLALRHSSASTKLTDSNERLEFLGDAILDAVIADYLFKKYPLEGEGFLTEMKSRIVSRKKLGEIGTKIGLKEMIIHNADQVNVNHTIAGNALEALIGAIYLDKGYGSTEDFIFKRIIIPHIDLEDLLISDINYKSKLLEWSQKLNKKVKFNLIKEDIMNHNQRNFLMAVAVNGKKVATGEGQNKKSAEKIAAKNAIEILNIET